MSKIFYIHIYNIAISISIKQKKMLKMIIAALDRILYSYVLTPRMKEKILSNVYAYFS